MIREDHWDCNVKTLSTDGFVSDPAGWFSEHSMHSMQGRDALFLAHADDGVIWGRLQNNQLLTSSQLFKRHEISISPPLRADTLQDAYLFCEAGEIRVWRSERGFQACSLHDVSKEEAHSFDEKQILWGTRIEGREQGFTLLADGRQGLRHAVPLDIPASSFGDGKGLYRPLRLILRHYLAYSEDGCARIYLSRLLDLRCEPIQKKGGIKR